MNLEQIMDDDRKPHSEVAPRATGPRADRPTIPEIRPHAPASVAQPQPARQTAEIPPTELDLAFHGSARDYFRIWIVNLCLSLVTLGIFSAWAKVRKKRYMYSHTTLGGTPFQYLARPEPILKGRIIAVGGFILYYLSSHFVTTLFPYVMTAGMVAAPWVLSRSAAFKARYSAFRNMTFYFDGTYWGAFKTLYAWGIVPAFVVASVLSTMGHMVPLGIASAVFSFHFPWFLRRINAYIVEHTAYGGKKGDFSATGGQFFGVYFTSGLIILAIAVPAIVIISVIFRSANNFQLFAFLVTLPVYLGYVIGYAFVKARSGNIAWNHIRIGSLYFKSTLRTGDLVKLYITNAIGIIASLGLLIPWAVIRTLRYRVEKMRVLHTGTLTQFRGSEKRNVAAAGAEAIDIFDLDLAL
jgi:uncharacterized membrane protein YjgN (DUF898 family)